MLVFCLIKYHSILEKPVPDYNKGLERFPGKQLVHSKYFAYDPLKKYLNMQHNTLLYENNYQVCKSFHQHLFNYLFEVFQ